MMLGVHVSSWSSRRWVVAGGGAALTALLIGLPTEMIANPWFDRMTPVRTWDRPVWLLTSVLAGLLLATFVAAPPDGSRDDRDVRRGGLGGVLAFFAVGCPVCNKLVVLALGTTGAHTWFEPVQPILGLASLLLLGLALRARLRGERACALPAERSSRRVSAR
jgi:hypothetical protein